MTTENVIVGLFGLSIAGFIGYKVYKKSKGSTVTDVTDKAKGPNGQDVTHNAAGSKIPPDFAASGPALKTASTRNTIFNPAPSGKAKRIVGTGDLKGFVSVDGGKNWLRDY